MLSPRPLQTHNPALLPPYREPSKTKLVTFFQTDLSGLLPQSVVDAFFPRSMAGFYANLQKALRSVLRSCSLALPLCPACCLGSWLHAPPLGHLAWVRSLCDGQYFPNQPQ